MLRSAIGLLLAPLVAAASSAPKNGEEFINTGWQFHRGDVAGRAWAQPSYDASGWAPTEVPHDWSADDLPPRAADASSPVLAVRAGAWKFYAGKGNAGFADPALDDSTWKTVTVPGDWRDYGYTTPNATAWYRRTFSVSAAQLAAAKVGALRLALGTVSEADVTFVNGVQVGGLGSMGGGHAGSGFPGSTMNSCDKPLTFRSYGTGTGANGVNIDARTGENGKLAGALKEGDNVIAVQVWSPGGPKGAQGVPAGLFDTGAPDERSGPFDAGASPGQRQTGYAVGGVGIYRKSFPTPSPAAEHTELFVEGCYMNCELVLNGKSLGTHPCE